MRGAPEAGWAREWVDELYNNLGMFHMHLGDEAAMDPLFPLNTTPVGRARRRLSDAHYILLRISSKLDEPNNPLTLALIDELKARRGKIETFLTPPGRLWGLDELFSAVVSAWDELMRKIDEYEKARRGGL